jgi:hypothetical protein
MAFRSKLLTTYPFLQKTNSRITWWRSFASNGGPINYNENDVAYSKIFSPEAIKQALFSELIKKERKFFCIQREIQRLAKEKDIFYKAQLITSNLFIIPKYNRATPHPLSVKLIDYNCLNEAGFF